MRLNILQCAFAVVLGLAFSSQVFAQAAPQGRTSTVKRIAPEDLLAVQVWDAPEFSLSLRVTAGGDIRLPMVKDLLHVAGLLPTDVEKLSAERALSCVFQL